MSTKQQTVCLTLRNPTFTMYSSFYQFSLGLGIEPMALALLVIRSQVLILILFS